MNQVAQLRPAGVLSADRQPVHSLAMFLADELLPEMIFNWPNGANRIEQNLQGAAQAYARQLSGQGFTPALIRTALQAEVESEREFMPKPIELANRCRELQGGQGRAERPRADRIISPAAVRMMAESRLWCADQPTTDEAVAQESARVAAEYRAQGLEITGGNW